MTKYPNEWFINLHYDEILIKHQEKIRRQVQHLREGDALGERVYLWHDQMSSFQPGRISGEY